MIHYDCDDYDDYDDYGFYSICIMIHYDDYGLYIYMYGVYPQMATLIGRNDHKISSYWCVLRRECSRMIHFITSNNHPSNPQSYPFPTKHQ